MSFMDIAKKRRSRYALNKNIAPSQEAIETLTRSVLNYVPAAFGTQSTRLVLLWDEKHDAFWEATRERLRQEVPQAAFDKTSEKIDSFKAARGTYLYYIDEDVVQQLQAAAPLYKDLFPQWAEHNAAIVQFSVWTALADANVGASLQHYNPLVDPLAAKAFDIPTSWRLVAQMPFGGISGGDSPKEPPDTSKLLRVLS